MSAKSIQRPVRVAMVHYRDSAAAGGSWRVGETIANHLDPRRIAAEMVFAYGSAGPAAKQAKVPCHFIGADGPKDFAAWIRARGLFKKLQPDIIHFQDGVVWLRAALAATPYRKILHVHGSYQSPPKGSGACVGERKQTFTASRLLRTFLKFTDAQVCINHGAREALLKLGWITPERSYVVYNSIDVARFSEPPKRVKARADLNLPPDAKLLGMVCRLVWDKGCGDLISIIERLPVSWHGVICGDGPQANELKQTCERRGLTNRIHLIGARDDVVPVYAALDAYIFLSRYEPFGLVLAEAMASGVPVFGIQSEGEFNEPEYPLLRNDIVEMLPFARARHHDTDVPPQMLDQLAGIISRYGEQPDAYRGMIARARTWADTCFNASLQAEMMGRVYESICTAAGSIQEELSRSYQAKRREAEALLAANDFRQTVRATA